MKKSKKTVLKDKNATKRAVILTVLITLSVFAEVLWIVAGSPWACGMFSAAFAVGMAALIGHKWLWDARWFEEVVDFVDDVGEKVGADLHPDEEDQDDEKEDEEDVGNVGSI